MLMQKQIKEVNYLLITNYIMDAYSYYLNDVQFLISLKVKATVSVNSSSICRYRIY